MHPTPYQLQLAAERKARLIRLSTKPAKISTEPGKKSEPVRKKPLIDCINDVAEIGSGPVPSIAAIAICVAGFYNMDALSITGDSRLKNYVRARHISMYLAHKLTKRTYSVIGRYFRREHTTVIHGVENVRLRIAADPAFAAEIENLWLQIATRHAAP